MAKRHDSGRSRSRKFFFESADIISIGAVTALCAGIPAFSSKAHAAGAPNLPYLPNILAASGQVSVSPGTGWVANSCSAIIPGDLTNAFVLPNGAQAQSGKCTTVGNYGNISTKINVTSNQQMTASMTVQCATCSTIMIDFDLSLVGITTGRWGTVTYNAKTCAFISRSTTVANYTVYPDPYNPGQCRLSTTFVPSANASGYIHARADHSGAVLQVSNPMLVSSAFDFPLRGIPGSSAVFFNSLYDPNRLWSLSGTPSDWQPYPAPNGFMSYALHGYASADIGNSAAAGHAFVAMPAAVYAIHKSAAGRVVNVALQAQVDTDYNFYPAGSGSFNDKGQVLAGNIKVFDAGILWLVEIMGAPIQWHTAIRLIVSASTTETVYFYAGTGSVDAYYPF